MAESVKKSVVKKRNQTVLSNSSRFSFYNEKEDANEIDNYHLEYGIYLLRKTQNRILTLNKQSKEENIEKYFVSQRRRYEELLDENVKLSKEVKYFKTYYEIMCEIIKKIEEGEEVLKVLRETEYDTVLKSLSGLFSYSINQLQLVDIDKNIIDNAFKEKIWGSESEIEVCLKKIEPFLTEHKVELSEIASQVSEIKNLALANTLMRERFNSIFKIVSKEIVDTNYKVLRRSVKKAYEQREKEKTKSSGSIFSLDYDFEFLYPHIKPPNTQQLSLSFPNLESSYPVMPNSSSTPQHNHKVLK